MSRHLVIPSKYLNKYKLQVNEDNLFIFGLVSVIGEFLLTSLFTIYFINI